jgi:methylase of polypeptide subunit release factors
MKTLNIALALTAAGTVDVDASLAAAKSAILNHIAQRETELETVSEAVHSTFDALNGAKANMPYVVGQTLRNLNVQPENFKTLEALVQGFIRENAGDRDSGKSFNIGKGKGGGVLRWSDQPAPKPEAAK